MVDADTLRKITQDVALDRPASGYSADMLRARAEIHDEWEAWKKDHPDATLSIPSELPD